MGHNGDDTQWHLIAAIGGMVSVLIAYTNIVTANVKEGLSEKDAMLREEQKQRLTIREHEAFKIYIEHEIGNLRDEIIRLRAPLSHHP